jgi:uncharacterized protein with PIN domain
MESFYRCKYEDCSKLISDQSLLIDERVDLVIMRCPYCKGHITEVKKKSFVTDPRVTKS